MSVKGPSQSGTHPAYYPQYQNSDGVWKDITTQRCESGVKLWPFQPDPGDIVHLMSYEAAMAIIYQFKAARGDGWVFTRIAVYQLTYSVDTEKRGYIDIRHDFDPAITSELEGLPNE